MQERTPLGISLKRVRGLHVLQSDVYELTVQRVFSAAHAINIRGVRETLHGHDWHVTVAMTGDSLDDDGLLVDFHVLERVVDEVIAPFRNTNLNAAPPFDRLNPTAENVASYFGRAIERGLHAAMRGTDDAAASTTRLAWVRVTEAPGCAVTYRLVP